jgi:hypothetical protein
MRVLRNTLASGGLGFTSFRAPAARWLRCEFPVLVDRDDVLMGQVSRHSRLVLEASEHMLTALCEARVGVGPA